MRAALEALQGVKRVEMDLEGDLFRVTGGDAQAIAAAIRDLGYESAPADPAEFRGGRPDHPVGTAPSRIAQACEAARATGKRFVLVDCHAPT